MTIQEKETTKDMLSVHEYRKQDHTFGSPLILSSALAYLRVVDGVNQYYMLPVPGESETMRHWRSQILSTIQRLVEPAQASSPNTRTTHSFRVRPYLYNSTTFLNPQGSEALILLARVDRTDHRPGDGVGFALLRSTNGKIEFVLWVVCPSGDAPRPDGGGCAFLRSDQEYWDIQELVINQKAKEKVLHDVQTGSPCTLEQWMNQADRIRYPVAPQPQWIPAHPPRLPETPHQDADFHIHQWLAEDVGETPLLAYANAKTKDITPFQLSNAPPSVQTLYIKIIEDWITLSTLDQDMDPRQPRAFAVGPEVLVVREGATVHVEKTAGIDIGARILATYENPTDRHRDCRGVVVLQHHQGVTSLVLLVAQRYKPPCIPPTRNAVALGRVLRTAYSIAVKNGITVPVLNAPLGTIPFQRIQWGQPLVPEDAVPRPLEPHFP